MDSGHTRHMLKKTYVILFNLSQYITSLIYFNKVDLFRRLKKQAVVALKTRNFAGLCLFVFLIITCRLGWSVFVWKFENMILRSSVGGKDEK